MEEELVSKKLSAAGIDAPDEVVTKFCQYLKENDEETKPKKAKKSKKKTQKYVKMGPSSQNPNELADWEERLTKWENKMQILDKQLEACQNIQSQYSISSSYIEEEAKNDKLSAYPILRPDRRGRGFIHPPEMPKSSRYRYPIYKNEVYTRPPDFIHEFRIAQENDFIPSPMLRHDDLRWRIKERIIYSHPDHCIRKK